MNYVSLIAAEDIKQGDVLLREGRMVRKETRYDLEHRADLYQEEQKGKLRRIWDIIFEDDN